MSIRILASTALAAVLAAGCATVGPDFQAPAAPAVNPKVQALRDQGLDEIADAIARNNHLPFASADSIALDREALPGEYEKLRVAQLQLQIAQLQAAQPLPAVQPPPKRAKTDEYSVTEPVSIASALISPKNIPACNRATRVSGWSGFSAIITFNNPSQRINIEAPSSPRLITIAPSGGEAFIHSLP